MEMEKNANDYWLLACFVVWLDVESWNWYFFRMGYDINGWDENNYVFSYNSTIGTVLLVQLM